MADTTGAHNLALTFGSLLIGLMISAVIYGITLSQTVTYYRQSGLKDPRFLKIIVLVLWAFDTLHLILCIITVYWYLITNFSNPSALTKTVWALNLQTDCNGVIGLIVECFFARRVWILGKNIYITATIVVLSLLHFVLGIVFTVEEFILQEFSRFPSLIWIACTGLGAAAATDIIIAASMCWYLWKSRTGFKGTDSIIATLMAYSINTGLLTSIIATGAVITFAVMPSSFVWLSFFWVLGKCYVNSFLATLNNREALRNRSHPDPGNFLSMSTFSRNETYRGGPDMRKIIVQSTPPLAVAVERTTEFKTDFSTHEDVKSQGLGTDPSNGSRSQSSLERESPA